MADHHQIILRSLVRIRQVGILFCIFPFTFSPACLHFTGLYTFIVLCTELTCPSNKIKSKSLDPISLHWRIQNFTQSTPAENLAFHGKLTSFKFSHFCLGFFIWVKFCFFIGVLSKNSLSFSVAIRLVYLMNDDGILRASAQLIKAQIVDDEVGFFEREWVRNSF